MRVGVVVHGILTRPLWVKSELVFPEGTKVQGQVVQLSPIPSSDHIRALLDGDFTPQKTPLIDFNSIEAGGVTYPLHTVARMQKIEMVRFAATPHRSLPHEAVDAVKQKIAEFYDSIFAPGKGERALRLAYSQLPYHPQRIWTGSEFVADLSSSADINLQARPRLLQTPEDWIAKDIPPGAIVKARLETAVNSDEAKRGEAVKAVLTEPLFSHEHQVLLTEGTELNGTVLQAKPSRSFGRNGKLRFLFQKVSTEHAHQSQTLFGTVSGAAGAAQSLKIGNEGQVEAQPDNNRYIGPLILGVLAAHGLDDDGGAGAQVTAANGFGVIARIVALTSGSRNVATGFGAYGFAKSIYFRFIARGHAVIFPQDTPLEVQLSPR